MSGKAWRDRRAEINARPDPPGYRRRRSAIPLLITLLALVVLALLVVAGVLALAITLSNPQAQTARGPQGIPRWLLVCGP